jgi:hypothetical protein
MSDGDQMAIRAMLEQMFPVMVEIRDALRQLVAIVSKGAQPPPQQPQSQGQMGIGVRMPKDASCPYCKSGVGQPCSNDQNELPVKAQDGLNYHASRMRAVGLWPPRG